MAVSGSTDFKSTAVEFITDARRLLGINAEEEALSATDLSIGLRFLTKMLKSWEADPDLGQWLISSTTLTLVQGTASYLFGSGGAVTTVPFEILSDPPVTINRGSNDFPMERISRGDYARLPNKTTQGYPVNWFYDRQRDSGTFYVWPAPDVTAGTVTIPYRRRIMDVDGGTDNVDLPAEWEDAITYALAERLIPTCGRGGTPEAVQVVTRASDTLAVLKAFDLGNDEGVISIMPASRYGYRSR